MKRREAQKQGSHDGACGFYAIGNALAVVCPEIWRHLDDIFFQMFKAYLGNNDGSHFIEGMGRNLLNNVQSDILKYLSMDYRIDVSIQRPFWPRSAVSLSEWRERIISHFQSDSHTAAIIGYEYCKNDIETDYWSHWTVIKNATARSLHTFDSSQERKYIPFGLCRIWDDKQKHKARPYKIDTSATFLFSR